MRWSLAYLAFAACGGSDGTVDVAPLAWSWSFVDASGADVGCPANVPTVELVAYQAVSLVGECLEPPREVERLAG